MPKKTLGALKSMLNSAVGDGIITRSPAAGVKPLKDDGKKQVRHITGP